MDSPFIFSRPLQREEGVVRNGDTTSLAKEMRSLKHLILWEPEGTGKRSLLNEVYFLLKKESKPYLICQLAAYNKLCGKSLLCALADALFRTTATTQAEWDHLTDTLLPLSHPTVSFQPHQPNSLFLDFTRPLEDAAVEELFTLPARLALAVQKPLIVIITSFQTTLEMEDALPFLSHLGKTWKQFDNVGFVLCGSGSLAYDELFAHGHPFNRFAERFRPAPIEKKQMAEFIIRNFTKAGRVISREFAEYIYEQCEGHPFYCQEFGHFCFSNTRGYLSDAMFQASFEGFLDAHQIQFERICAGLTRPQLYFLKALSDRIEHFSTTKVLTQYHLNSSANVFRVRTALQKKGIVDFRDNRPYIIDPIFKLWFTLRFCNTYWF